MCKQTKWSIPSLLAVEAILIFAIYRLINSGRPVSLVSMLIHCAFVLYLALVICIGQQKKEKQEDR